MLCRIRGYDMIADDALLAEQVVDYYRRRAREYDVTAYGTWTRRGRASPG
jgi:hypothetical protein